MSAGYSGTPLATKLGIKPETVVFTIAAPREYRDWLKPLPDDVVFVAKPPKTACDVVHLFATSLAELKRELPKARTIKLEDPPTPFKTSRILEASKDTPVRIFGGLGGVFLLEELMAGATGAMTGFAYPEILVEIVRSFRSGDRDHAAGVFYRNVPLMRFEFQEGIGMAIRKEVLKRRGVLKSAALRAPGTKLDAATSAALDRVLSWVKESRSAACISA